MSLADSVIGKGRASVPVIHIALVVVGLSLAAPINAQTFGAFPSGVLAKSIDFVAQDGGSPYAVVGTQSFGVYRANPGEPSSLRWVASNSGLPQPLVVNAVKAVRSGLVLAATTGWGGLFRSRDGGVSWELTPNSAFGNHPIYSVATIAESPVDGLVYIATDDGSIMLSRDGGESWVFSGKMPGGAAQFPTVLLSHPTRQGVLYAGTSGLGVMISPDDGSSWSSVPGNSTLMAGAAGHVFDLLFDPANPERYFAATARGAWLFDSTVSPPAWRLMGAPDGVTRIRKVDGDITQVNPEVRSLAITDSGYLYAATWGHGVLRMSNPVIGPEFDQLSVGSGMAAVLAISPDEELMVSTQGGFIIRPNASGVAAEPADVLPSRVALNQNYPNPFNPETVVEFDLPNDSWAQLSVFDGTGTEVSRPHEGRLPAGHHSFRISGLRWPSGVYLYRLTTDGTSESRFMTLVR